MTNHKADARANPAIELSSPPGMFKGPTYEHAARAGDFIFVAGQVAKDEKGELVAPNDAAGQAKVVFDHLGKVLAHAGATPQDIVMMNTYLTDRADSKIVTEERFRFLGDHRPPHTGVIIAGLGAPEVKLEVEVVAYAPRKS